MSEETQETSAAECRASESWAQAFSRVQLRSKNTFPAGKLPRRAAAAPGLSGTFRKNAADRPGAGFAVSPEGRMN